MKEKERQSECDYKINSSINCTLSHETLYHEHFQCGYIPRLEIKCRYSDHC